MSGSKIPCSVSLLTLNAADSLPACLDALREFDDIIVCDGNSTDGTRAIAEEYGARVIKQYDTDEPSVPCAMDKAAVRERAMAESKHAWRFFMDADDTLSQEAVEEIRTIVTNAEPEYLIWRMPTRIFIDGHEILHEATYPSYQTRLVHEKVAARFKGPVHDHLVYDDTEFPVGTMQSYYNFHWSRERVSNYWKYLSTYIKRELQTTPYYRATLSGFLYWGVYRRARIIAGYALWRLPGMYVRYGFRDSMPLSVELQIVAHHFVILFSGTWRFIASRSFLIYFARLIRGEYAKTIARDIALQEWEAYGKVLDVGGHPSKSYWKYLQTNRWFRVTTTNASTKALGVLPLSTFDTVLLFDVRDLAQTLDECVKMMRKGGVVIGAYREDATDILRKAGLSNTYSKDVWYGQLHVFEARKLQ